LAAGAPVVLQGAVAPLPEEIAAGRAQRGGVVKIPLRPRVGGSWVEGQQVGRGRAAGQRVGRTVRGAGGKFGGAGLGFLLRGQPSGFLLLGRNFGLGILIQFLVQRLRGQAGQGLQAVLRFNNGVLLGKLFQDFAALLDSGVSFGVLRQVLHRTVVVSGSEAVFLQVFVIDAARQQVGVALLQAVGSSGFNGLPQQLQRLRIVLFAVVQPRHFVVNLVAVILVFRVFQQAREVLVQPRPVLGT